MKRQKFTAEDVLGVIDEGFRHTQDYAGMPKLDQNLIPGVSEVGKRPVWTVMHVALTTGQLFEIRARETRW